VLWFNLRPAGGGVSDQEGRFSLPLTVLNVEPGGYLVEVKTRSRRLILRQVICQVPTPTPTLSP
jgi:hypothetical protein